VCQELFYFKESYQEPLINLGEGFRVPLFREAPVRYKDRQMKVFFLFAPEAETNFLGPDLMSELGIKLNIHQKQIQISLNLLSLEEEQQILPEIWTRDRNLGGLNVPPIHIELKIKGGTVRRKQFLLTTYH
jgi:hypothetical protein